jgi:hypothetical protein
MTLQSLNLLLPIYLSCLVLLPFQLVHKIKLHSFILILVILLTSFHMNCFSINLMKGQSPSYLNSFRICLTNSALCTSFLFVPVGFCCVVTRNASVSQVPLLFNISIIYLHDEINNSAYRPLACGLEVFQVITLFSNSLLLLSDIDFEHD